MKIGLDIHGVIDTNWNFFAELTRAWINAGHEVHILTGPKITPALEDMLESNNIQYTHIFSITDYQESIGTPIVWKDGDPHMDPYMWDKSKGEYCKRMSIDMHLDDSDIYAHFFKTPYARFFSKDTDRVKKTKI